MHVCMYAGCRSACLQVCMSACSHACMLHACMHVCMHSCMYVCTCMYVYVRVCTCIGGRHWPLLFSVPIPTIPQRSRSLAAKTTGLDQAALLRVCRTDTDARAVAFRRDAAHWIQLHPLATIEDVNRFLVDASTKHFPSKAQATYPSTWSDPAVTLSIRHMWQAYRTWREATQGGRRLFEAWRAYSQFKRAHRDFRKRTRAARTARLIAPTCEMQQAADKGDVRAASAFQARRSACYDQSQAPAAVARPTGRIMVATATAHMSPRLLR